MKKHKTKTTENNNLDIALNNNPVFEPEVHSARVTISSRVSNKEKFQELYSLIDSTKDFKNQISQYCYSNLTLLVSDYIQFLTNYKTFNSPYLNSWEKQNLFQEIAAHYYETAQRYLNKAKYIVTKNKKPVKYRLSTIANFINDNSYLNTTNNLLNLDFNIENNLERIHSKLAQYGNELIVAKNNKEVKKITKLEKLIISYNRLIITYQNIRQFSLDKPQVYQRLINLILTKKLRLLNKVKLGEYKTGTHARHLDNAQMSIIKDLTNGKYQYFLRVRKFNKLIGREPKKFKVTKELVEELKFENKLKQDINNHPNNLQYQEKLAQYNKANFIYLPLIFNEGKLKSLGKTIDAILEEDNPQILLKAEQLRIGTKSRKIHLIFCYKAQNNLGKIIKGKEYREPNEGNTLGVDANVKNNLLVDSNKNHYTDILGQNNKEAKSKFVNNINEIVLLQSKPLEKRTEKEIYRYDKLLRTNESLLKTYLSKLIKDWKKDNILHLVLEDLNLMGDQTCYQYGDIKIKYSRLARLLRLSQIKHWIASMAEKQGLFTHFVNPAYTSQECSGCHYISDSNRKNQENFVCKSCENKINADENSAINIKYRLLNSEIRNKLGKDNVYLCSRPKAIYYKEVKTVVEKVYNGNGVVTELLPTKKEASPF